MNESEMTELMYELIPEDGSQCGNKSLHDKWSERIFNQTGTRPNRDQYREIREFLLQDGRIALGRGKGGSVKRVLADTGTDADAHQTPPADAEQTIDEDARQPERELYRPFANTLRIFAQDQEGFAEQVIAITAQQGRKNTGGKWTRPDISLIGAREFIFMPRQVELVTFEIKPKRYHDIDAVYEAVAHRECAHRAFLAINESLESVAAYDLGAYLKRLQYTCVTQSIGLLLFEDPNDVDTFEVVIEAPRHEPDPRRIDDFISSQFTQRDRDDIRRLFSYD